MHLNGFTTETKLPLNHAVPAGKYAIAEFEFSVGPPSNFILMDQ